MTAKPPNTGLHLTRFTPLRSVSLRALVKPAVRWLTVSTNHSGTDHKWAGYSLWR